MSSSEPLPSIGPQTRWRRHGSGVPAGLSLLDCGSAYDLAVGYAEFREHSGLDHAEVVSEFVVTTPLPAYPERDDTYETERRWPRVNAQALWHPAFWLPMSVAERHLHDDLEEPDPVWAVRICLELAAAGLYDRDRGWVDVLDEIGIRVEQPEDLERVRAWQRGGADPELEALELTSRLVRPDRSAEPEGDRSPDWAADASAGLIDDLLGRAWAVHADEFLGWVAEADSAEADSGGGARVRAETMASLGSGVFAGAAAPGVEDAGPFWDRFAEQVADPDLSESALLAGPLAAAKPWLATTRVHYWPSVEAVVEASTVAYGGYQA